ncbi:hypothetical protein [Mucilaginibacter myungsuensis]|uniref:Uncharacterized protein n=1 Tax=Mucilaginibacter myungsuensis TaxID=649104 RepID=A0A929KUA0_9SPHI|nr:hypothetical protein [Mucilaginibacter myungsuensis]MBE9660550.1 hypothetical protein [Mucilaginibacter myungsuensis]MDN3600595.1 hypothetical protein [Mucilaginibacter myungsuensis]
MIKFLHTSTKAILLAATLLTFSQCKKEESLMPLTTAHPKLETLALAEYPIPALPASVPLKNMFGINAFEWDFLENPHDQNNRSVIYEAKMSLIKTFSGVRHYMDWEKLENAEGSFTFNPTNAGGWNYDIIYSRCKQEGMPVVADLKTVPNWLLETYPADQRDNENVPAPYGAYLPDPASYYKQALVAFQFAARYGSNTAVDPWQVKVNTTPRWTNDPVNEKKIGLGLVKYIECDNERDKWWKGPATKQTAEEYAANMSAFYDGHKGTMGANAGVKTADPNMLVVMGGIATCDTMYVQRMINWCKTNRGYRADGSVNLCFDVINYHYYSSEGRVNPFVQGYKGIAPELSMAGEVADAFVRLGKAYGLPVWVTEAGYDVNQGSWQKVPPVGSKSVLLTQADWVLRTSLLYARHGIQSLYHYLLFDANDGDPTQYATSGLNDPTKRRPAADYILQTKNLMGDYSFVKNISKNPMVDQYTNGIKTMYVLVVPDQKDRKATYKLDLGKGSYTASIYKPKPGANTMTKTTGLAIGGKLTVTVTETPMFIQSNQ